MEPSRSLGRAFAALALCAVAACGKSSAKPSHATSPAPTARGGGPLTIVSALENLATEQCAHEGRCARVGPGRRHATAEACRATVLSETRTRLTIAVCESGYVDDESLRECLDATRASDCATTDIPECEPASLCSP